MHETVPQSKPTPDYPLWIWLFLKETLHVPGTGYGLGFENKMVSTAFQRNLQEHSKVYSNLQWQNCFEKKIKASKYIFDCFLFTQLLLIKPQLAWRARQMWRNKKGSKESSPSTLCSLAEFSQLWNTVFLHGAQCFCLNLPGRIYYPCVQVFETVILTVIISKQWNSWEAVI